MAVLHCGALNGAGELAFLNINVNMLTKLIIKIFYLKKFVWEHVEAFKVHSKSP